MARKLQIKKKTERERGVLTCKRKIEKIKNNRSRYYLNI